MRGKKIRFVYMLVMGIGISFLLNYLTPRELDYPGHNRLYDTLLTIFITMCVWEGNLRIDHWMDQRFPWVDKPGRRLLVHLPVGILFSVLVIYLPCLGYNYFICKQPAARQESLMIISITIGVLITLIILSMEIGSQFFKQWKQSLVEIEKYKAETLQAQLSNLKNQISPHFLFNNLSVLSSLVYTDQDKAVDFINQLSKVFRYLLDNRNNELVRLEEELAFIHSYTALLGIRFSTSLHFKFDIPEEQQKRMLPPMSLQILIENAIKHNEISEAQPLTVCIRAGDGVLEVSNDLQLRIHKEPSSFTGLQNIRDRYRYFTDIPVEVLETEKQFRVRIPLLHIR
jgi:two-component system LytT family sensor kinase